MTKSKGKRETLKETKRNRPAKKPWDNGAIPPAAQTELRKFEASADDLLARWARKWETCAQPQFLYHYTTHAGLKGILESGTLWLTDVFDFNDTSELKHGIGIAARILRDKAKDGPPEASHFSLYFDRFVANGVERSAHYFACCFSTCADDLGQWRAYADNGRGFALEFEADTLVKGFIKNNTSTFPITYCDAQLSAIHEAIVANVFPHIMLPHKIHMTDAQLNEYMRWLSALFSVQVLRAALFFKHPAYENEAEFRFLELHRGDYPAKGLKYRQRPAALVRFREFDWRKRAGRGLRRVIVGPGADKIASLQYAKSCLRAFHPEPESVDVAQSDIPYRAQ